MKDSLVSIEELDIKLRERSLKIFASVSKTERTSQKASLDSDLASNKLPIGLSFYSEKYKFLLGYLILLHYYPLDPVVQCYFFLDLQEHLEKSPSFWLSVLLDKDLFLRYLVEQQTMTEQQFYSGIMNETFIRNLIREITYIFEERLVRPKRIVRRKGYRDKGSRGSDSEVARKQELQNDEYLTLYQLILEEKREIRSDKCSLLREHLSEGRVLTDELLTEFKLLKGDCNERETQQSIRNREIENYVLRRAAPLYPEKERKS